MPFPFEVSFEEIRIAPDAYVDAVFGSLQSEFVVEDLHLWHDSAYLPWRIETCKESAAPAAGRDRGDSRS